MTNMIYTDKIFEEDAMELLPAYLVLAEANICLGPTRLKKAEEFLIAAYWNLLKNTSDESGKGADDSLVTKEEIQTYRAKLHKTFGRLFLAQGDADTHNKALEELSQGIYLECLEHGPESYQLCSSYFYMGELFRVQQQFTKSRSYFSKIAQIWKKFILEKDLKAMNLTYSSIDVYHYNEALQHLSLIKQFFESEFGTDSIYTAEVYFAFALVCLKNNDGAGCFEDLQKAFMIYEN